MTAMSSARVVLIRDGAMRNYSRIFCGKGVAVTDRFGTLDRDTILRSLSKNDVRESGSGAGMGVALA